MVKIEKRGKVWVAHYIWASGAEPGFTNFILNTKGNWVKTGGRVPSHSEFAKMYVELNGEWQKLLSKIMLEDDVSGSMEEAADEAES